MSIKEIFIKQTDNKNLNSSALCAKDISAYLKNDVKIICFDVIDSTNNEAKRNAGAMRSPTLFVANEQTAGRGRLGRQFYSPNDTGLYMSLYLDIESEYSDIVCMTSAAAVCVTDALVELCDVDPKIKWVNDIYLNDKKICGILCEGVNSSDKNKLSGIIIGIGINISTTDFPKELLQIAGAVGTNLDRNKLCALICDNIIQMQKSIKDRNFIDKYKERSMVLGNEITYIENGQAKTATAIDIDIDGGLVIKTGEETKTLCSGEISVRLNK